MCVCVFVCVCVCGRACVCVDAPHKTALPACGLAWKLQPIQCLMLSLSEHISRPESSFLLVMRVFQSNLQETLLPPLQT